MRIRAVHGRDVALAGCILSAVGDQAIVVVTAFTALRLLGDSAQYGLFSALGSAAPLLLAALSGLFADHRAWARRLTVGGLLVRAALNALLGVLLLTAPTGSPGVAIVALGVFQVVHSAVGSLTNPALLPTLRLVAEGDAEWLDRALSVATVQRNVARLVGPVIGGLVVATADAGDAYLLNAVSFLLLAAPLAHVLRRTSTDPAALVPARDELRTGYRGLVRHAPDHLVFQAVALVTTTLLVQPYLVLGRIAFDARPGGSAPVAWAVVGAAFAAGGILAPMVARRPTYRAIVPATAHYEIATLLGLANAVLLAEVVSTDVLGILVPTAFVAGLCGGFAGVSVTRALHTRAPGSLGAATALGNLVWSASALVAGLAVSLLLPGTGVEALGVGSAILGAVVSLLGLVVMRRFRGRTPAGP